MIWQREVNWTLGRASAAQVGRWLTAIAVILAVCAISLHLQARASLSAAQREYAAVSALSSPSPASASAKAFVQRLGPPVTAEALAAQLAELATSGVAVAGFTATPREPTASTLGRTEVQLQLQGPYPAIKQALAQLLDLNPSAVLAHLTMRREASGVDAQVTLWLLSPPLQAPG